MMRYARTASALAAAVLALAVVPARGALKAVRVAQGPKVDGRLNDDVWRSAEAFSDFRQADPKPGEPPTEATEVLILYDHASLYIGVLCRDGEPSRLSANTMAHDGGGAEQGMHYGHVASGASDDLVRVLLDPFQDKRTAYLFFVNPLGARGEGLAYAGESSLNWDGIWEARAHRLPEGWSAELRIPFKTIAFKPGLAVWGINVERIIARKQETIRLSGTTRNSKFENPMEAAALEGITGVEQGKGFTFRPYGLASAARELPAPRALKADAGFDIYKNFTPNLVGAVSYNMDFAETEVDDRRINLTRFPLFFPEKRMFFLEGSETFSFSSSISFTPFISRKIGLIEGRQIPVVFGTKLYGKVGDWNLSALDVQTGRTGDLDGQNLFAARMTRNIFSESKIGWVLTNGSPSGERNTLAGMDLNFFTSKFLGRQNLMAALWGVYNWNEREGGRHYGFGARAEFPNDLWNGETTYAYYGDALDPGLGYMMRRAIQTYYIRMSYQPRPKPGFLGGLVRQFYFQGSVDYYWDLAGKLETRKVTVVPLSFRTESGEVFRFEISPNRDVLPYAFEISRGVILPAGPYDYTNVQLSLKTATHRPAALDVTFTTGGFYSGRLDQAQAGLTVKLDGAANLGLNVDLVRGRLPQGRFSENVYQLKADLFLSPDLGLMNYIQYDDISRQLGWSSRLRWQVSPGNEIYLVFNKNWERRWDPMSRFVPLEDRGVLKISLSIRP